MPQLKLKHAIIADVTLDEQPDKRLVVLNVNEEDFFEMLDGVNPKNIIKYLDMRGIQHRAPSNITFYNPESCARIYNSKKYKRLEAEQERLRAMIKEITS